ncbi:unnamed protein product [Amoebophrya sp. A120]|nr:unnamed protein product [Amoebophrya sp. A120]|eukprot:GSA120T00015127001.1
MWQQVTTPRIMRSSKIRMDLDMHMDKDIKEMLCNRGFRCLPRIRGPWFLANGFFRGLSSGLKHAQRKRKFPLARVADGMFFLVLLLWIGTTLTTWSHGFLVVYRGPSGARSKKATALIQAIARNKHATQKRRKRKRMFMLHKDHARTERLLDMGEESSARGVVHFRQNDRQGRGTIVSSRTKHCATSSSRKPARGASEAEVGEGKVPVELVVFADEAFQKTYDFQLRTLRCYAKHFGYRLSVLPQKTNWKDLDWAKQASVETKRDCLDAAQRNGAFAPVLRHCLLAAYLESKVRSVHPPPPGVKTSRRDEHEKNEKAKASKSNKRRIPAVSASMNKDKLNKRNPARSKSNSQAMVSFFQHLLRLDLRGSSTTEAQKPRSLAEGIYLPENDDRPDNTVYVLLDADMAAHSLTISLEPWARLASGTGSVMELPRAGNAAASAPADKGKSALQVQEHGESSSCSPAHAADVVLFDRNWGSRETSSTREGHNDNELMAGTYLLRNNPRSRQFLRQWAVLGAEGRSKNANEATSPVSPRVSGDETAVAHHQETSKNVSQRTRGMDFNDPAKRTSPPHRRAEQKQHKGQHADRPARPNHRVTDSLPALRYKVELVVFTQGGFQSKYRSQLASLRCYAERLGYGFNVFSMTDKKSLSWVRDATVETQEGCLRKTTDVFFLRHCLLAAYLDSKKDEDEGPGKPPALYFALDADIASRGFDLSLRPWAELALGSFAQEQDSATWQLMWGAGAPHVASTATTSKRNNTAKQPPADVMFFERIWGLENHNELMAGAYMVQNTARARRFLRQWASWEEQRPPGYSSADNGAIHMAVPEALGVSASHCEKKFAALTSDVTDLSPYAKVLLCVRQHLGMGATPDDPDGSSFEHAQGGLLLEQMRAAETPEAGGGAPEDSDHATAMHPDRVIPGLRLRILGKEAAWAPDWWASNAKIHPLGHGIKNMNEGLQHHWFTPDMLSCLDAHGIETRLPDQRTTPLNGAAFISEDSKALHRAVPESLGIPVAQCEKSEQEHQHAPATTDRSPYASFVNCTRVRLMQMVGAASAQDASVPNADRGIYFFQARGDERKRTEGHRRHDHKGLLGHLNVDQTSTAQLLHEDERQLHDEEHAGSLVIPNLAVRLLGWKQSWASDKLESGTSGSPFGHLKNITEAKGRHWFGEPMLSCVDEVKVSF